MIKYKHLPFDEPFCPLNPLTPFSPLSPAGPMSPFWPGSPGRPGGPRPLSCPSDSPKDDSVWTDRQIDRQTPIKEEENRKEMLQQKEN